MAPNVYGTWLQNTRCLNYEGSTLTVGVPNTFHKEYLEKRIPHLIGKTLKDLGYGSLQLRYAVVADEGAPGGLRPRPALRNGGGHTAELTTGNGQVRGSSQES